MSECKVRVGGIPPKVVVRPQGRVAVPPASPAVRVDPPCTGVVKVKDKGDKGDPGPGPEWSQTEW